MFPTRSRLVHRFRRFLTVAPLLAAAAVGRPALAQQDAMNRAFDFERRGNYASAVEAYRSVLARRPGDLPALLGLERSLLPLNRSAEIIPFLQAAQAANAGSAPLYGIAVRAWAAADQPDSIRVAAERWARMAPRDESPYREWGAALVARRDRAGARAAYQLGRERLARPEALAAELAQLAVSDGDFPQALREWVSAVQFLPGYRSTAVASLSPAPARIRPDLLRQLAQHRSAGARSLEAELRAHWGDPVGGFRALEAALPAERPKAIEALRSFLDQIRADRTAPGRQAQALALEALATRTPGGQGARLRLEAAQAYADAGDGAAARRMLGGLASDGEAPPAIASGAATTLVGVLVDEGKPEEAERRLAELERGLSAEDSQRLRRRLVAGWVRQGRLERAEAALAKDSTVDGLALSGRLRLYRGDLKGATDRFRAAGPYAGSRDEATERTALLALLQPIEEDSLPALGQAFFTLARGDTTAAIRALDQVAGDLDPAKGGAELRLMAGRLAAAQGKDDEAERLLEAAAVPEAPGTAPAAELALAQLLDRSGRGEEAVRLLEHMILTYPQSALIPQARRALDEARAAVPKT